MTAECDCCGDKTAKVSSEWQDFEYNDGRKTLSLRAYVDVISCSACGTEYTSSDAEDRRHEAVCKHLGRMTPAEIRGLRAAFGLTQVELAKKMDGISLASVKRWELGECIQGIASDQRLRRLQQELAAERGAANFVPKFVTILSETVIESERTFVLRPSRRRA